jgi:ribonuclease PH
MTRNNARKFDQLRPIKITTDYLTTAQSSCLVEFGNTKVICAATLEDGVPFFLKNSKTGWLTAEYGMLPCSCETRVQRNKTSGRTFEIQRLIGRSLRSVVRLDKIGERTIKVDCDVVQADGGTRTASVTGSFVVVAELLQKMRKDLCWVDLPLKDKVAAVSVGMHKGDLLLDLDFEEDAKADMDMNIVMRGCGDFIEVQGTAEGRPFSREHINQALDLAQKGIEDLFDIQLSALKGLTI